ncbi:hypothetical protein OKZ62_001863 [Vibrio navarrensis]|nr:hypothetical protein [Vibrio navarrensis]
MMLTTKEAKAIVEQFEISIHIVPFEHESRTKQGKPAVWYRVFIEAKIGKEPQRIVVSTSRKDTKRFANVDRALSYIENELDENQKVKEIKVERNTGSPFNLSLHEHVTIGNP